jgi:predicted nucleic acid-binding protein
VDEELILETTFPVDLEREGEVCWQYGRLFRFLKQNGLLIDTNDLWIAATAVVQDTAVVTRNHRHFRRIPELRVLTYGS